MKNNMIVHVKYMAAVVATMMLLFASHCASKFESVSCERVHLTTSDWNTHVHPRAARARRIYLAVVRLQFKSLGLVASHLHRNDLPRLPHQGDGRRFVRVCVLPSLVRGVG